MPNYKLQKKGRSARRVEVRAEHIEIQVLALVVCALLAFFIWLYIVGVSKIPHDMTETTTPVPETTSPVADPQADEGQPSAAVTDESYAWTDA